MEESSELAGSRLGVVLEFNWVGSVSKVEVAVKQVEYWVSVQRV